jgi:hypothetical protein
VDFFDILIATDTVLPRASLTAKVLSPEFHGYIVSYCQFLLLFQSINCAQLYKRSSGNDLEPCINVGMATISLVAYAFGA